MAGNLYSLFRTSANKVTKVEIKNKKLSKEISVRATDNSSTKADEMHISPTIAIADVIGCL